MVVNNVFDESFSILTNFKATCDIIKLTRNKANNHII